MCFVFISVFGLYYCCCCQTTNQIFSFRSLTTNMITYISTVSWLVFATKLGWLHNGNLYLAWERLITESRPMTWLVGHFHLIINRIWKDGVSSIGTRLLLFFATSRSDPFGRLFGGRRLSASAAQFPSITLHLLWMMRRNCYCWLIPG